MSSQDRIPLFPSRANLVLMKQRILSATKGLSLLKRRRDALELKLREMRAELKSIQKTLNTAMQEAYFAIYRANFLGTDFKPTHIIKCDTAESYLRLMNTRTLGLYLPWFSLIRKTGEAFPFTGLSRGGVKVTDVREKFQHVLEILVSLASLEYSVVVLNEGLRLNNMRVNGLEFVVVPRFINTITYIRDELDEFEREDFYRLKRSQAKQRVNKAKFAELVRVKNMTPEELLAEQQGITAKKEGEQEEEGKITSETKKALTSPSEDCFATQTSFILSEDESEEIKKLWV